MRAFVIIAMCLIPLGIFAAIVGKDYRMVPVFIFLFAMLFALLPAKKQPQ